MKCRLSLFPNPIARGVIFYVDGELSASIAVGLMTIFQAVKEDRIRGARRIAEKYGATLAVYTNAVTDNIANIAYIVRLFKSFFPSGRVIIDTDDNRVISRLLDESCAYEVVDSLDVGCIDTPSLPIVLDMPSDELRSYLCKCMCKLEYCFGCVIVTSGESAKEYIEVARSCGVDIVCEPQMLIRIYPAKCAYEVETLDCDSL